MRQEYSLLIVDDNKGFVDRMSGMLHHLERVRVKSAGSYEEAVIQMFEKQPDLVLLDINLPGKSGISLLKKIKETGGQCEVIMISNFSAPCYRERCKKLGALAFLDKTGEFEQVPNLIAEVVHN